jgi:acyl-CoA oxidase
MALGLYKVMELIQQNEDAVAHGDFKYFQQIHLLLCQCKAFFTWWDHQCVSDCIQACGGHGYSAYSGLTSPFTENFANQILEGENSLLCLQVARYLLNLSKKLHTGDTSAAIGQFAYLLLDSELEEFKLPETKEALSSYSSVIQVFQKNAAFFVKKTSMSFMRHTLEGLDLKEAWNYKMGTQLLNMSKSHSFLSLTENFFMKVETVPAGPIRDALDALAVVFVAEIFREYAGNFTESGSLTSEHFTLLGEMYEESLDKLTPNLLVLAEVMQIPDEILGSAIGHSNGKPYENLYKWAKELGAINQLPDGVHPEITRSLKARQNQKL